MKNINQLALKVRRDWGSVKPGTKVMKSKKDYNRKDKSWMKDNWHMWKSKLELNKTGQILALVQDETGIYNQLMTVEIDKNKNQIFYTNGSLGFSHRVQNYMIKAGIYLDELCSNDIIEKYCTTKFIVKQFKFDENPIVLDTFKTRSDAINFLNKLFKKVKNKFGKYNSYKPVWITDECFQVFCCDSFRVESFIIEEE